MKLLMEEWRRFVNEASEADYEREHGLGRQSIEQELDRAAVDTVTGGEIQTIGDLKKIVAGARRLKTTKNMKGALGNLVKQIATLGTNDLAGAVKSTYKLPDDTNMAPALSWMNVDDQVSAIVDDNLENAFLKTLEAELKSGRIPDDTPIGSLDMTKMLSNFIAGKHDKRTVHKPESAE